MRPRPVTVAGRLRTGAARAAKQLAADQDAGERAAQAWNDQHPAGTLVRIWPMLRPGESRLAITRSIAWTLGHGRAVVLVTRKSGGMALTHVEAQPIEIGELQVDATLKCVNEVAAIQAAAFLADQGIDMAWCEDDIVGGPLSVSTVLLFAEDALERGFADDEECARMIGRMSDAVDAGKAAEKASKMLTPKAV